MVDWKNNPITEPSPDFPDSDGKPVYDEDTETIKYDAIGNPTTYFGAALTWNGRELTELLTVKKLMLLIPTILMDFVHPRIITVKNQHIIMLVVSCVMKLVE